MIQRLIRQITLFSFKIYCEWFRVKNEEITKDAGPILILANHPDSFLDAVFIGAKYPRKVHFMARGDVFRNPIINKILRSFGMIPIHRLREGIQHMSENENSFSEAVRILKNKGIVLIFIEGICLNKHELQPFKKGTVRILEICKKEGFIPKLHLAGIAYQDFREIKKRVNLNFDRIECPEIGEIKQRKEFNEAVFKKLEPLIEVPPYLPKTSDLNWVSPYKIYYLIFNPIIKKIFFNTVFYDSVLFAIVFFLGTIFNFLILMGLIIYFIS